MKILMVEDDRTITEHLSVLLREEGFLVTAVDSREKAMECIGQESFDLALVDLSLPDGNGYPLCTALKSAGQTPVIFLTASDDEASIVTGFALGAEDYVTKPFKPGELMARIKKALRQSGKCASVLRLGDLKVDTVRVRVQKREQEIQLSALEYRLLLVLMSHPGEVLSREQLLDEIWDAAGGYVNDNTLTVYIKRLREKLEDDPANPVLLQTVRSMGYRMGGVYESGNI